MARVLKIEFDIKVKFRMKTFLRLSFYLLFVMSVLFGGYSLYKSPIFYLEKINYSYSYDTSNVLDNVKNSKGYESYAEHLKPQVEKEMISFQNKSLWDIDIFDIEQKLKKLSWIENVSVSRQFPNELSIRVELKKIIANIIKSPSKVQPVAYDSTLLTEVEFTKAPLVPILSGKAFSKDQDLRKKALTMLEDLPLTGSFSYDQVSEVYSFRNDRRKGEFKILLKNTKAMVLINTENVPLKAKRISKVIDYMDPSEMKDRVIDSNFSKKVLVRPRNHR